jgi:GT2 family glycosyltransferase
MEWNTPVGEAKSCGGDAIMRTSAFTSIGGYNPAFIAGEEPEFCVRLREKGWKIIRIDAAMTLHDAAMSRFGQWWKRAVRCGHAYAEGAALHGCGSDRHNVRPLQSILFWGITLPMLIAVLAWPTRGLSLLLLLGYLVLWYRVMRSRIGRGDKPGDGRLYATFCVLGKFAQARGVLMYSWNRWIRRQRSRLIEYKAPAAALTTPIFKP